MGMQNLAHVVDARLIQNDHSNQTQVGIMREFYTAMQDLEGGIEKNAHDNQQMDQNFVAIQQQMGGIGKASQVALWNITYKQRQSLSYVFIYNLLLLEISRATR